MTASTRALKVDIQRREAAPMRAWTEDLRHLRRQDAPRCGGKAANLGEMIVAGFDVPPGFVVATSAFDAFIEACGDQAMLDTAIPSEVAGVIVAAVEAMGDVPLAVRSSGVAEDLADASFAGQYDTFLDVRGAQAVLDAVRRCWASTFSEHARAYQETHDRRGSMAVVVQQLVHADSAGVAFSANPVTGVREEVVLSAVRGLGERLVSGEVSPDEWIVGPQGAVCRAEPEGALTVQQVEAVATLARRVHAHYGAPQDIEWAWHGESLYLLQARPITALPDEPIETEIDAPQGYWEREVSHFPSAMTPMSEDLILHSFNDGIDGLMERAGLLMDTVVYKSIGGLVYMRFVPLGGKDISPPPAWLMPIIMPVMRRLVPSLRKRLARAVAAVDEDWFFNNLLKWRDRWQAECQQMIDRLRDKQLDALADDDLLAHLHDMRESNARTNQIHFSANLSVNMVLAEFVFFCRDHLGWTDDRTLALFVGTSEMSTAPARELAPILTMLEHSPDLRRLVAARADIEVIERAHPDFGRSFAEYLKRFGSRALRLELADPTISELPGLTIGLLAGMLQGQFDAQAVDDIAAAKRADNLRKARQTLRSEDEPEFERLHARAALAYPIREDAEYYTMSCPLAFTRYAVLEVGRRLAQRRQLDRVEDVFFLREVELADAIAGHDHRVDVAVRRGHRAWAAQRASTAPPSYGKAPPAEPPEIGWMPDSARRSMQGLLWMVEASNGLKQVGRVQDGNGGIEGVAAAAGTYTGTVRVVLDEREFPKLQPGDVLVCRNTSPVWSVVFPNLGALVTDSGGLLSHPSIIAREYGIPAVVATGNATLLLRDGQSVRVDGTSGRVELV